MFEFFTEKNLISDTHSGFKPGDSCINQLLSITHDISQSFNDNLEIEAILLDISKAFNRVWYKGLIEVIYVTNRYPAFCLTFHLTGVHFRRELQPVGDVIEQKCKY